MARFFFFFFFLNDKFLLVEYKGNMGCKVLDSCKWGLIFQPLYILRILSIFLLSNHEGGRISSWGSTSATDSLPMASVSGGCFKLLQLWFRHAIIFILITTSVWSLKNSIYKRNSLEQNLVGIWILQNKRREWYMKSAWFWR